jgi:sulfatase modifying factor 1
MIWPKLSFSLFGLLTVLVSAQAELVSIDTRVVGNAGNAADRTGYGAVDYEYEIGTYMVTNAQYAAFLNIVDPSGGNARALWNSNMASNPNGGITFNAGASEGEKFSIKSGYDNMPVVFVSWFDAARFTNWLHNGGTAGASTETGAYTLNGAMSGIIMANSGAIWWIPTEDEWYKAAYYDASLNGGAGGYHLYATQSSEIPNSRPPNDIDPNSANFVRFGPADGDGINDGGYADHKPGLPSGENLLTDVGAYSLADSYYGTFDQDGNAWEWNDAVILANSTLTRGIRGGAFETHEVYLASTLSWRASSATAESRSIGFRVATIPEPSAALLLLTGGAALLLRRRQGFFL